MATISSLEKRMEKQSEYAREDRRRIYEKLEEQSLEWPGSRESCGAGASINGDDRITVRVYDRWRRRKE